MNSRIDKAIEIGLLAVLGAAMSVGTVQAQPSDKAESPVVSVMVHEAGPAAFRSFIDPKEYCKDTEAWPEGQRAVEQWIVDLVNAKISADNCCPGGCVLNPFSLQVIAPARCAGRRHAKDMLEHGFVSHVGSDNSLPYERMDAAGFFSYDNLIHAYAQDILSPSLFVDALFVESRLCERIVRDDLRYLGVGFADDAPDSNRVSVLLASGNYEGPFKAPALPLGGEACLLLGLAGLRARRYLFKNLRKSSGACES